MGCQHRNVKQCILGCLKLSARILSTPPRVKAERIGCFCVKAVLRTEHLKISAALVCGVGVAERYEYLQVIEGNLITIDNEYMLVLKK